MSKKTRKIDSPSEIRNSYLKHEAAIMMVGQFYYLIGLGLFLCALTGLLIKYFGAVLSWSDTLGVAGVFLCLGVVYAVVGYGFRSLSTWSRYAGAVLAILCLASLKTNTAVQGYASTVLALVEMFAMPIGIVFTLYAAYLVMSPKGSIVFSKQYRKVIADTPEIRYTFREALAVVGIFLIAVQSFMLLAVFRVTER